MFWEWVRSWKESVFVLSPFDFFFFSRKNSNSSKKKLVLTRSGDASEQHDLQRPAQQRHPSHGPKLGRVELQPQREQQQLHPQLRQALHLDDLHDGAEPAGPHGRAGQEVPGDLRLPERLHQPTADRGRRRQHRQVPHQLRVERQAQRGVLGAAQDVLVVLRVDNPVDLGLGRRGRPRRRGGGGGRGGLGGGGGGLGGGCCCRGGGGGGVLLPLRCCCGCGCGCGGCFCFGSLFVLSPAAPALLLRRLLLLLFFLCSSSSSSSSGCFSVYARVAPRCGGSLGVGPPRSLVRRGRRRGAGSG